MRVGRKGVAGGGMACRVGRRSWGMRCVRCQAAIDALGKDKARRRNSGVWNLFKGQGRKDLSQHYQTVRNVNQLEQSVAALADSDLQDKTGEFRRRIANGEKLESILPEAFAVVREASYRKLGMRHFDTQIIGGIVLHRGEIAEMQTGEGKTLVSTLPAYLNALDGGGVQIVTVNDYLARRDAEWMGHVHEFLGLSVDVVQSTSSQARRRQAYSSDITYVTNSELGFDYLRDNMVFDSEDLVLPRQPNYAIIDEVDSVLIDEGRNPLLISYQPDQNTGSYDEASGIASALHLDRHYTIDPKEKTVELTEEGMEAAEVMLGIKDLWEGGSAWGKYIMDALKAKEHFLRDVQYIVKDDQIQIIDEFTGRLKPRSRWSDGIHQAVEAKEGLEVQGDQVVAASITYQCFFKMYKKLAGMTGTAATESEEFWETYGLRVVPVPTNKPCIREDLPSLIYPSEGSKWEGVVTEVAECHAQGQPVLVGTTSVGHSELLARWLGSVNIPYSLLNAKPANAAQEAEIVAQAGRLGAVTISTNMAGRGTDILLGGSPYEMAKGILLKLLSSALMETQEAADLSAFSEALMNIEMPPEQLGFLARAQACALSECDQPLTLEEVEYAIMEICNFARQFLEFKCSGEEALQTNDYSSLEELIGTHGYAYLPKIPERAMLKLCTCAVFLCSFCCAVCKREGEIVRTLGGLRVIGTQLHDSRRIDNQLRGRSGRQGDPGSTIFILSLQDDLLKIHGGDRTATIMTSLLDENTGVTSRLLDSQLQALQRTVEEWYAGIRKQVYKYDQLLDIQRKQIYSLRKYILLSSVDSLMHLIYVYLRASIAEIVETNVDGQRIPKHWDIPSICTAVAGLVKQDDQTMFADSFTHSVKQALVDGTWKRPREHRFPTLSSFIFAQQNAAGNSTQRPALLDAAKAKGRRQRNSTVLEMDYVVDQFTEYVFFEYFERLRQKVSNKRGMSGLGQEQRVLMLELIDSKWQKHLRHMNDLRNSVSLRVFGQLDPLEEYKIDGAKALIFLVDSIRREIVGDLFTILSASEMEEDGFDTKIPILTK